MVIVHTMADRYLCSINIECQELIAMATPFARRRVESIVICLHAMVADRAQSNSNEMIYLIVVGSIHAIQ